MAKTKLPTIPGTVFREFLYTICQHYSTDKILALKDTLFKIGVIAGEELRKRVEDLGLEVTMDNFLEHNHFLQSYSAHIHSLIDQQILEISQPLADGALHRVQMSYGFLICEFHKGMLHGYNSSLNQSLSSCILLGSHSCQLVTKLNLH